MKYINVMYDYEYDDDGETLLEPGEVDIVLVPNFVHDNLDDIVQKFNSWVGDEVYEADKGKHPNYWVKESNGRMCMSVGTDHFVDWINDNYFHCENQESKIIEINTKYNPEYPSAEF